MEISKRELKMKSQGEIGFISEWQNVGKSGAHAQESIFPLFTFRMFAGENTPGQTGNLWAYIQYSDEKMENQQMISKSCHAL